MNILAVCSTINFRDFTRRATIEAIKLENENLDVLLFTSFKNLFKRKIIIEDINFGSYHFWIPDKYKKIKILNRLEHFARRFFWTNKFAEYDYIFFTDPNQAWLLPYIKKSGIVYLIRDPNLLQNIRQKDNEHELLVRSHYVLATSKNLAEKYTQKYHGLALVNLYYWPNCVDTNIWKAVKIKSINQNNSVIGIAGNFSPKRTDYALIDYITTNSPELNFEIAGILDYNQSIVFWDKLFLKPNVKYLGNIPFDKLPAIVAGWSVGLVTDKMDEYASYMHHNKVYQYLALGKPVVSLKIHDDYDPLYPCVLLAENYSKYLEAIYMALKQSKFETFRNKCIALAAENSSRKRAKEFTSIINQTNG